jgi:hypothetical protein
MYGRHVDGLDLRAAFTFNGSGQPRAIDFDDLYG